MADFVTIVDFVINHYEDLPDFDFYEDGTPCMIVKYAIYSEEVGMEEGNEHLQGMIHLTRNLRWSQVQKISGMSRASMRYARCPEALRKYCMKPDSDKSIHTGGPYEYGVWTGVRGMQGAVSRKKREDLIEYAKSGASVKDLMERDAYTYILNPMGYKDLVKTYIKTPKMDRVPPKVWFFHGENGSGKSQAVVDTGVPVYFRSQDDVWWDEYDGVSDICFDDFYGWVKWGTLLRLLDNKPARVGKRGGPDIWINPKNIYITSNGYPDQWYAKCLGKRGREFGALIRRIHVFREFYHSEEKGYWTEDKPTKNLLLRKGWLQSD